MPDETVSVVKKRNKVENEAFIVEFMVGQKVVPMPAVSAPNKDSIGMLAAIVVATNWPSITGFNLYRYNKEYEYEREFLMHVPAMEMVAKVFSKNLQEALGAQVLRAAVPVKTSKPEGEDLQKLMDEGKKHGQQLL